MNTPQKNEYLKQYRKRNKDKINAYFKQYKKDHSRWFREIDSRGIIYKGKKVFLGFNPRTQVCSLCRKQGKTEIHHMKYHDDDPLKDTIELCFNCHREQHKE